MTDDPVFAAGQVWTYRGAQLGSSRVIVGAVDRPGPAGAADIVSISVSDAMLPDPDSGVLGPKMIQHCPIGSDMLAASVLALEATGAAGEGFLDGYATWRAAYDSGQGGFFTLPVGEIVQMFQTMLAPERSAN